MSAWSLETQTQVLTCVGFVIFSFRAAARMIHIIQLLDHSMITSSARYIQLVSDSLRRGCTSRSRSDWSEYLSRFFISQSPFCAYVFFYAQRSSQCCMRQFHAIWQVPGCAGTLSKQLNLSFPSNSWKQCCNRTCCQLVLVLLTQTSRASSCCGWVTILILKSVSVSYTPHRGIRTHNNTQVSRCDVTKI